MAVGNIMFSSNKKYQDINPTTCGFEDCHSSHSYGPAIRRYWLIHFVVSGTGIFKIDNKTYNVKQGEMFVIPPFVETYYEADEINPWNYIWIGFEANENVVKDLPPVIKCPEAFDVFNAMKIKSEVFSGGRATYLIARIWDLLTLISDKSDERIDYVEKALDFIHSEYMHGITVEEISDKLKLDRTYFSTLFKRKIGVSPKKYLSDYRMSVAASLITENRTSVSVAAFSVGYSDVFNFSKMFKKHFGISPKNYVKGK